MDQLEPADHFATQLLIVYLLSSVSQLARSTDEYFNDAETFLNSALPEFQAIKDRPKEFQQLVEKRLHSLLGTAKAMAPKG